MGSSKRWSIGTFYSGATTRRKHKRVLGKETATEKGSKKVKARVVVVPVTAAHGDDCGVAAAAAGRTGTTGRNCAKDKTGCVLYYLNGLSNNLQFFTHFERNDASNVDANLPPGGSGWPIVGETLDFFINPEKFLSDRMKRHSPDIFRTNFFGEKFVIICGSSGHKFLFSNEDKHFTAYLLKSMQKLFFSTQRNTDKGLSNDGMKMPQFLAFILKPEALVKYVAGSSKQAKFSGKKSSYSLMWCYSSRREESRSGSLVLH